jgi:hypothetical protein
MALLLGSGNGAARLLRDPVYGTSSSKCGDAVALLEA